MLCYSWNVNGIRSVARKDLLPWRVLPRADVICLQETKAQQHMLEPALGEPEGWHSHWHSAQKPGYSSVAIISREAPDEVMHGIGDDTYDSEGRVIAARFGTLVVVSAYFPNSRDGGVRLDYKLAFCAQMESYLEHWRKRGFEVILQGDYNIAHNPIDLARPKENEKNSGYLPQERAWLTRFLALGYRDVFRDRNPELPGAYTWWTNWGGARARNVGWRIDYSCVSPGLADRVTEIRHCPEIAGSDHCPVAIEVR
ncbi:MAG: exodeoxyribonuclease III [Planctomycetes bacterium]|nr:exodeoxyribonuclease III [Planctomycetota bacterium]